MAQPFRKLLPAIAIVLFLLAATFVLHSRLPTYPELRFPPGPDQINYLTEAPDFQNRLLVDPKVPLYTVWFSLFFASAPNLYQCFYAEKYASLVLLSILVGFLGRRLFDLRTGLFLGLWTLNAKYLVIEPNGTSALAASMFVAAALCLTARTSLRWPAAVLCLFLSVMARPEMLVPFALVITYVVGKGVIAWRKLRRKSIRLLPARWYQWVSVIILVGLLTVFVKTHANLEAPWSPTYAFFTSFAVNYVRRNNLLREYPDPWLSTREVIPRVMPQVTEPVSPLGSPIRGILQAWTLYPGECLHHIAYNVKLAMITLPAVVLGFHSRALMLIATVVWIASYFFVRGSNFDNFKQISANVWRDLLVLGLASASLVAVSIFFIVMWRYYLPLLPVALVSLSYLVHRALKPVLNYRQKRSRL